MIYCTRLTCSPHWASEANILWNQTWRMVLRFVVSFPFLFLSLSLFINAKWKGDFQGHRYREKTKRTVKVKLLFYIVWHGVICQKWIKLLKASHNRFLLEPRTHFLLAAISHFSNLKWFYMHNVIIVSSINLF